MKVRTTNRALLKKLSRGKEGDLIKKAECSPSTLEKSIYVEGRNPPNENIRLAWCEVLEVKMDVLFPWSVVGATGDGDEAA